MARRRDILHALAASALAVGGGLASGVIGLVDPLAWKSTVETLYDAATNSAARREIMEGFNLRERPLTAAANIAGVIGGVIAGKAMASVAGRMAGKAGGTRGYVLEARRYREVGRSYSIMSRGDAVYQKISVYSIERGVAKRVPDLGVPDYLVGEMTVRAEPSPPGTRIYLAGWLRGKPIIARPSRTARPPDIVLGEHTNAIELIGEPKTEPVIFDIEKWTVKNKPMMERKLTTTNIIVKEPGPLKRVIARIARRRRWSEPVYEAITEYQKTVYLGEKPHPLAGGLPAEKLIDHTKPVMKRFIVTTPVVDVAPELSVLGMLMGVGVRGPRPLRRDSKAESGITSTVQVPRRVTQPSHPKPPRPPALGGIRYPAPRIATRHTILKPPRPRTRTKPIVVRLEQQHEPALAPGIPRVTSHRPVIEDVIENIMAQKTRMRPRIVEVIERATREDMKIQHPLLHTQAKHDVMALILAPSMTHTANRARIRESSTVMYDTMQRAGPIQAQLTAAGARREARISMSTRASSRPETVEASRTTAVATPNPNTSRIAMWIPRPPRISIQIPVIRIPGIKRIHAMARQKKTKTLWAEKIYEKIDLWSLVYEKKKRRKRRGRAKP